jgi:hypothetical protein
VTLPVQASCLQSHPASLAIFQLLREKTLYGMPVVEFPPVKYLSGSIRNIHHSIDINLLRQALDDDAPDATVGLQLSANGGALETGFWTAPPKSIPALVAIGETLRIRFVAEQLSSVCTNCGGTRHSSSSCSSPRKCMRCSASDCPAVKSAAHPRCTNPACCPICSGPHHVSSCQKAHKKVGLTHQNAVSVANDFLSSPAASIVHYRKRQNKSERARMTVRPPATSRPLTQPTVRPRLNATQSNSRVQSYRDALIGPSRSPAATTPPAAAPADSLSEEQSLRQQIAYQKEQTKILEQKLNALLELRKADANSQLMADLNQLKQVNATLNERVTSLSNSSQIAANSTQNPAPNRTDPGTKPNGRSARTRSRSARRTRSVSRARSVSRRTKQPLVHARSPTSVPMPSIDTAMFQAFAMFMKWYKTSNQSAPDMPGTESRPGMQNNGSSSPHA